jgi:hypothetical protein
MADKDREHPSPTVDRGSPEQFDKAFEPVAIEIGQLAKEWNSLHEHMGLIFSYMVCGFPRPIPLAVWHSPPSDRTQREMLRAALGPWTVDNPALRRIANEVKWVIDETERLSGKRNDALHAPIQALMNADTFQFHVEPNYIWGHPMAKRLQGKDVRAEINEYRIQTAVLSRYAHQIYVTLVTSSVPLPQRPTLPKNVHIQTRAEPPRPKHHP